MSKTGMEREDWAVYNALYPGVAFQPEHRGQLAARLREIAARLEAPPVVTNELPQPEVSKNDVAPTRKRRGARALLVALGRLLQMRHARRLPKGWHKNDAM